LFSFIFKSREGQKNSCEKSSGSREITIRKNDRILRE